MSPASMSPGSSDSAFVSSSSAKAHLRVPPGPGPGPLDREPGCDATAQTHTATGRRRGARWALPVSSAGSGGGPEVDHVGRRRRAQEEVGDGLAQDLDGHGGMAGAELDREFAVTRGEGLGGTGRDGGREEGGEAGGAGDVDPAGRL